MASVWTDIREAGRGQLGRNGLQHSDTVLYASLRNLKHRLLQMANEQRPRFHHVPLVLRLRRCLADVRIRDSRMSSLKKTKKTKKPPLTSPSYVVYSTD